MRLLKASDGLAEVSLVQRHTCLQRCWQEAGTAEVWQVPRGCYTQIPFLFVFQAKPLEKANKQKKKNLSIRNLRNLENRIVGLF